jgi:hypothetical protein
LISDHAQPLARLEVNDSGKLCLDASWPAGRNHPAVGKKLTRIVEKHDAVAQQAPALFWVSGEGAGGVPVGSASRRARREVMARRRSCVG